MELLRLTASTVPEPALTPRVRELIQRVHSWLFDTALPFWAEHGLDQSKRGFHEDLNLDGSPGGKPFKRLRTQCRQIFVFAEAKRLGWMGPSEALIREGFDFITTHGRNADGSWAKLLGRDGGILDATPDLYDQAFVVLACATAYGAIQDKAALALAYETLAVIEKQFKLVDQPGYMANVPAPERHLQNPHMHLLEALMALQAVDARPETMAKIEALVTLFRSTFYDAQKGLLIEQFAPDWSPMPGAFEPGHHFEWVWLLDRYAKLGGKTPKVEMTGLYTRATMNGIHPQTGLVADEINANGKITRGSSRCWPNTEALRAHIVMAERFGLRTTEAIGDTTALLLDRYLSHSVRGAWMDQFDESGRPMANAIPASTFYHLLGAFTALFEAAKNH